MADSQFALADGTQVHPREPFFITGSGRCGSTLLRRLILDRAQIVIPPENYTLGLSLQGMDMAKGAWPAFCSLILHGVRTYVTNWSDFAINEAEALRLLTAIPPPLRTIANFWHGFHALYASGVGKPSVTGWGDKTPANVDRLHNIRTIFPGARFIFMVRDAFDAAYSFGCMPALGREGNFLTGAHRWVAANARIIEFAALCDSPLMILRYEDLVRSTDGVMDAVMRFLLLPPSAAAFTPLEASDIMAQPHLQSALGPVASDSIGRGRTNLPDEARQQIAAIATTLQLRFGYEPTGLSRSPLLDMAAA